jgi:tetratricopeptide (TPR) repeat protein
MTDQQIQHYRIVRQLGAGGMGVVYEAEDTRLGRHVALKVLPESLGLEAETVERFEREARIASSLNHPNICTIYDIGTDADHGGRRFIVMELLDGESLRAKIQGQPLPLDLVLDVGCQMADALEAAHAQGIVHRDIKPANILLTRRGQAKLLDFGVAKLAGDRHAIATTDETRVGADVLTTPGMAIGSINYMSPEQARGEDLDGRTDLFSLGLVLYEMATGRQAFSGQTTAVVFDAILNRQPPAPRLSNPALPDDLERVILRALEKDRRLRFQTAADLLAELSRLRRDVTSRTAAAAASFAAPASGAIPGVGASTPPVRLATDPRITRPAPRRSRVWAIGVPAGVVVLAAGYMTWNATKTPAFTDRDMVVVADFVNTTNDQVFDDALKQAVSVQLQQTPFITLLPDQRVQRTLRLMQRQPTEPVTGAVARELCQRAGAKATVEGSIAPLGSSYVLSLGVHNCQTGESLAEQQVQAKAKEDVLRDLGAAVTEIRKHLGESLASVKKYDVPVTDATTASLDALRAYGLANKARVTQGDEASIPFYQQAIERDPTFALAYAKLGVVSFNIGRPDDARKYALKAYELRDRVSEYERLYITWNHATRVLEDPRIARETLELMTASYPRDFAARNNLGVYYLGRGEFDEALKQYQAAIEIAPDEPLPLANAAYALFFLSRLDEAFHMVERSLAIRPDGGLAITRWVSALVAGDPRATTFESAARKIAQPRQIMAAESSLALWRGQLVAYGRLEEALRAQARAEHDDAHVAEIDADERTTLAVYRRGSSLEQLRQSVTRADSAAVVAQEAAVLAALGDLGPVRPILPRLEAAEQNDQRIRLPLVIARAYVRAADGQSQQAIADLEAALNEFPPALDINFHIGRIREHAGDLKGAESNYRMVIRAQSVLRLNPVLSVSRLTLGEVLVKEGNLADARAEFDRLLTQWNDADTEFDLLKQVKVDRAKIGGSD